MCYTSLINIANNAMEYAYAPYSHFKVGAALLTKEGKIFTGCNVENASYGATNCAERTAIFKAVSEGYREFEAIAIVSSNNEPTFPCGICRQVLVEFMKAGKVILSDGKEGIKVYEVSELLPHSFEKEDLNNVEKGE